MYISVENLYIFYGRIPNKKEPPFDYIELVRGTSDYSPKEIESAYYDGSKIKLGKYSLLPMDVLVWFDTRRVLPASSISYFLYIMISF